MVENTQAKKPHDVQKSHERIAGIFKDDKMTANDATEESLSRLLTRLPNKFDKKTIEQTVDVLFDVAASKIKDEHSLEVLANLRAHLATLEEDLYMNKPRYIDALFFPNRANVKKMISWL